MEQLRPIESAPLTSAIPNSPSNGVDITELVLSTPKESTPETKTKEFVVEEMKEPPGKVKIDFFGGGNPNSFINQPTESAKPDIQGGNYINTPIGGNGVSQLNPTKTKEEIRSTVSTIIAIVDYAIPLLGMYIAGEKNHHAFTADTPQKKMLETALVDYMYEKQTKLSAGWALILAIVGSYGFMLLGALKKRYDIIQNKKNPVAKTWHSETYTKTKEEALKHPIYNREDKLGFPPKIVMDNKPQMEKVYVEKKPGSGDLVATKIPVQTNIQVPSNFVSTWFSPDPNVTAQNRAHLEELLSQGIFPLYKKNENNDRIVKLSYNAEGKPLLKGRTTRFSKPKKR